jgi:hypothetical protein
MEPADPADLIEALLLQAQQAHGRYEATELNGVYDQEWPEWYAAYALEHKLGSLLGHDVRVDALAEFLASSYADFEQADPKPSDSWAGYIARRMVAEL